MEKTKRLSALMPLRIAAAEVVACFLVVVARAVYMDGSNIWNNPHTINFLVAWIPAIVASLLAVMPQKEWKTMRIYHRVILMVCGFTWSLILWHQLTLAEIETNRQIQGAVNDAVEKANKHSDEQFGNVETSVGGVHTEVKGLGKQLDVTTTTLVDRINDSGKPIQPPDPEKPSLEFSFWDDIATSEHPTLLKTMFPDKDGYYPVEVTFINTSGVSADNVDAWITICSICTLGKETPGFEKLPGSPEILRHKFIGSLNPSTNIGQNIFYVKYGGVEPFKLFFHYSCKACGKMKPDQSVTIFPLSSTHIPSIKRRQ